MFPFAKAFLRSSGLLRFSHSRILITGSGPDRIGIVRDLSGIIWSGHGNILDSSMTRLAGQFVVMVLADIPTDSNIDLQFELAKHKDLLNLNLAIRHIQDESQVVDRNKQRTCRLMVEGADHPGLLHAVADILVKHEINIEDLSSSFENAPMGGMLLFHLHGYLQLPEHIDLQKVREELAKASSAMGVEISLLET